MGAATEGDAHSLHLTFLLSSRGFGTSVLVSGPPRREIRDHRRAHLDSHDPGA
jgi:hypothetical protein